MALVTMKYATTYDYIALTAGGKREDNCSSSEGRSG